MIETLHLFEPLDKKLIELLRSLSPEEWSAPTRARRWTVKDIATHLLDGNVRTLSMSRDKYFGETPSDIHSYRDLVDYLNRLNADWVNATRRLSPTVLVDLLETTGKQYTAHLQSLDPFDTAIFSVDWAGEKKSFNWFHVAREYTEKWHHQQQIREAVNRSGIQTRELYHPVLDIFMQALPHHYRDLKATRGDMITIAVIGEAGGTWSIQKNETQWQFIPSATHSTAVITIDQDNAWKLLTKGLTIDEAKHMATLTGEKKYGEHFLSMLSVMA